MPLKQLFYLHFLLSLQLCICMFPNFVSECSKYSLVLLLLTWKQHPSKTYALISINSIQTPSLNQSQINPYYFFSSIYIIEWSKQLLYIHHNYVLLSKYKNLKYKYTNAWWNLNLFFICESIKPGVCIELIQHTKNIFVKSLLWVGHIP